jgi:hypothetical protein
LKASFPDLITKSSRHELSEAIRKLMIAKHAMKRAKSNRGVGPHC